MRQPWKSDVSPPRQPASVSSIEFDARAADAARQRIDYVWTGDVERLDLEIPPGSFDAIVGATAGI
jgi:hypothetical protein